MPEVHKLPDISEVEREASEWIARLNADEVSADDRTRFESWHAAHPLHARVYGELCRTWSQFSAAAPFVRAVSFAQSMKEPGRPRGFPRLSALAAAAVAGVMLAASGWLYFDRPPPVSTYRTALGEHATIALPDGSSLELNSDSAARVDFSKSARVIRLERGEAFFSVAHDAQRPFWVIGGGSWVRAVGTAFDVNLRTADVVVTVSEGTVNVGAADAAAGGTSADVVLARATTAVVTAGQQADLRQTEVATRRLSAGEAALAVAWREATLYFENRPLREVINTLNRYSTVQIHVEDEELNNLPVGGTFQPGPEGADALLTMLQQGFGVRVRRAGNQAYIEATPTTGGK
jgi:transmembrane sensor